MAGPDQDGLDGLTLVAAQEMAGPVYPRALMLGALCLLEHCTDEQLRALRNKALPGDLRAVLAAGADEELKFRKRNEG